MSVANDARDLPPGFGPPPDVNKRERAAVVLSVLNMTKPMAADFNRAVILYWMHLETAGHELSANWCGLAEHLAEVFHPLIAPPSSRWSRCGLAFVHHPVFQVLTSRIESSGGYWSLVNSISVK